MHDGPAIARVAALIGDPARAAILTALIAGPALTATELATEAGVTKQTASAHLGKLADARLVAVERQGRHRYYRLADRDVADLLERLMGVATRAGATRVTPGPREPALRRARVCYDHLAGDLGVQLFAALVARGWLQRAGDDVRPTPAGARKLAALGVPVDALAQGRRPLCRPCLDWSERRHHLAGALGAAMLAHFIDHRWARRVAGSRVVKLTPTGEAALRTHFGIG
ncbi:MAG: helix-turn-helix transcriptional regulator [Burkholderiales bacterium]